MVHITHLCSFLVIVGMLFFWLYHMETFHAGPPSESLWMAASVSSPWSCDSLDGQCPWSCDPLDGQWTSEELSTLDLSTSDCEVVIWIVFG